MPHGFSIELLGLRLGFTASSAAGRQSIERYVFPGLRRELLSRAETVFTLEETSQAEACATEPFVRLQQAVDEHVVQHAPGFAFVHCGAVGAHGAAALLVATSGKGKSTLVEELVGSARGVAYYSDEYAAIDAEGRLHPYPRSLLVRRGQPLQRPVTPRELGAEIATGPSEIRLVLELRYEAEEAHSGVRMTPLSQGEALHLLLRSTPQVLEDRPAIFSSLARVAAKARAYTGVRGEAREAAGAILDLLHEPRTTVSVRGY